MTHFHMDVWVPDGHDLQGQAGRLRGQRHLRRRRRQRAGAHLQRRPPPRRSAPGSWVGLDIPLSNFTNLTTPGAPRPARHLAATRAPSSWTTSTSTASRGRRRVPTRRTSGTRRSGLAGSGPRRAGAARRSPLVDSVLRLIWKEQRISRAEIARRTGLSRSTVSEIVDALLPTGLVAEVGIGAVERRAAARSCSSSRTTPAAILGVDMGAAHVGGGADRPARPRARLGAPPPRRPRRSRRARAPLIAELCDALPGAVAARRRGAWSASASRCPARSTRATPTTSPRWCCPPGAGASGWTALRRALRRAAAWWTTTPTSARWPSAGGAPAATSTTSPTSRSRPASAPATSSTADLPRRHRRRRRDRPPGHRPATASPASAACAAAWPRWSARRRWWRAPRELLAEHPDSVAGRRRARPSPTIEDAALAGDPLALQVVHEAAENLGIAVAGLLNLMNPSLVILGGGLARLGELLLEPLRETVRRRTLVSSARRLPRSAPASSARGRWPSAPPPWCSRRRSPIRSLFPAVGPAQEPR